VGYDASRGNAHGIARCIAAGLTDQMVEPMRRAFLSARPGTEARALELFAQGRLLEAQGLFKAALDSYSKSLTLDPLNLTGQRHYWALQRRMRPMTTSLPAIAR
jgi:serine/threonine-protein kinase